jgi:hypothetical protein
LPSSTAPALTTTPAPSLYAPVGPQEDVPAAATVGWEVCHASAFDAAVLLREVLASCPHSALMLACRRAGSGTYRLLAWAPRADALADVGDARNASVLSNGAQWFFSSSRSWGFARGGDAVDRDTCTLYTKGGEAGLRHRLVIPTSGDVLQPGCRCGAARSYERDWERVVLGTDAIEPSSTPSPTVTPSSTPSPSASLSSGASPSGTPTPTPTPWYAPYGPQVNVPRAALVGWAQCHVSSFNGRTPLSNVLSACAGPSLMLACRQAGNDTLSLLAWALREDATWDAGSLVTASRRANGAEWYFS